MRLRIGFVAIGLSILLVARIEPARGQGYGTDLQNVMAPASGGMAGVSTALPQDLQSAIFGNPATLAQFHGTQFSMGGGWVEGYPTIYNNGSLNGGVPFNVTSRTQGFPGLEMGVTQEFEFRGLPGTLGMGLAGVSGGGAEYRDRAPAGSFVNDITTELLVLGVNFDAAVQLTDQISLGAAFEMGNAYEQLGAVSPVLATAMVHAYGVRGVVGIDYALNPCNVFGFYYESPMSFQFPDGLRFAGTYRDVRIAQPATFGIGLANRALMGGNLLIAIDAYYKLWEDADLYQDVFENQYAFAFGSQLTNGRYKYRAGYSYNSNPLDHNVGSNLDRIPVGQDAVQLFQAAAIGTINQHRISAGLGYQGFMFSNVDLDMFVGGMLHAHDTFGNTQESLAVWYAGFGLTWQFDTCCKNCP